LERKPISHVKKDGQSDDVFKNIRPKTRNTKMEKDDATKKIEDFVVRTVNTESFIFPEEVKTAVVEKYKCTCCGVGKDYDNFYPSFSILHKEKAMMTICKDCVDVLWKNYLIRYSGDLSRSLYYFCMLLDVPYFKNIMEEVKVTEDIIKFFKKYMNKIISFGKQNNILTFIEGQILFDGTNEKTPAFFDYDEEEVNYIPNIKDVKFWGKIPPADIYFLNAHYKDWCDRYEVKDKGMETIVQQICHKELRIFRLNEVNQNTSNEIKDLQALMTSANLKPVQNKSVGTEENTLGAWIKRFENERPIPAPDPEFADVDGIWKKIRVWFLGHFSKVYNYENEYSREYKQEMSKYRVDTKEQYETKWATHQMGRELFK
jgi:hypothetical protein